VGGGATKDQVTKAFQMILKDPEVKGIFVNIFGGIMKCDIIAEGVIAATKAVGLSVPLVVRLEGTNVDLGRKLLAESGLAITPAADMKEGAAEDRRAREEGTGLIHGDSRRQEHPRRRAGDHRLGRIVPCGSVHGLRHEGRRRRHPGPRRSEVRRQGLGQERAGLRHGVGRA
jgi:hypothetical protein